MLVRNCYANSRLKSSLHAVQPQSPTLTSARLITRQPYAFPKCREIHARRRRAIKSFRWSRWNSHYRLTATLLTGCAYACYCFKTCRPLLLESYQPPSNRADGSVTQFYRDCLNYTTMNFVNHILLESAKSNLFDLPNGTLRFDSTRLSSNAYREERDIAVLCTEHVLNEPGASALRWAAFGIFDGHASVSSTCRQDRLF